LSQLLALAPNAELAKQLCAACIAEPRPDLRIEFEKQIPPSEGFLRWLIQNADKLSWPTRVSWCPETRLKRGMLLGRRDLSAVPVERRAQTRKLERERTMEEALSELQANGASGSSKKWWAFEGFTSVDCLILTRNFRLYIEGKRTDGLSSSIAWYRQRNQSLRNLESAAAHAGDTPFGCLIISEQPIAPISDVVICESLPHLDAAARRALMQNYLGNITWIDVCRAVGLDFRSLPETTKHAVRR
jgi:hypothetical protein